MRHSRIIAGLWLFATIWPVVSVPLHFIAFEHHSHFMLSGKKGALVSGEEHACAICNFNFCWKFPTPEKFILHKIEIRIFGNVGLPVVPLHKALQRLVLLRGPPFISFFGVIKDM